MESEQLSATVILAIQTVEVYQCVNQRSSLIETGPLNMLYIMSHNCFVLQVNNFTYQLSKEIPVLASPGEQPGEYPSYAFPNVNGYSIIKIKKIISPEALSSFETILNNHCDLAYKQEEEIECPESTIEGGEVVLASGERGEPVKTANASKNPKTEIASNIIYKGGEITKKGLIVSAEVLSKGIAKIGNYVQRKYIKKTEEKNVSESTVDRLTSANKTTSAIYTFTKAQVQMLITVGKEISKEVGKQVQKTDMAKKFEKSKYHDTVVEVGKSSLHAVACLYEGMAEALTIVGKGIGETTTKVVAHKYGEKAGDATKQGFEAVGHIGNIINVYEKEGAGAVREATAKKDKQV